MRTYLVFQDFPIHIEYRVEDTNPLIEGTEISFGDVKLINPKNRKQFRTINGSFKIIKRKIVMNKSGFSQYLELVET